MELPISEDEVLDLLRQIEAGTVQLTGAVDPQQVYCGNVEYLASNGWRLTVYNDCNEWDYLERIEAPDGRTLTMEQIEASLPRVDRYAPSEEVAWRCYGLPGHATRREPPPR